MSVARPDPEEMTKISVRVPPFWAENPKMWFIQLEAQFEISGITTDRTKFYSVVADSIWVQWDFTNRGFSRLLRNTEKLPDSTICRFRRITAQMAITGNRVGRQACIYITKGNASTSWCCGHGRPTEMFVDANTTNTDVCHSVRARQRRWHNRQTRLLR